MERVGVDEWCTSTEGDDLTGTLIRSSRPVAVFNGGMSRIPWVSVGHNQSQLMEQLMPVGLWGDRYVASVRDIPNRLRPNEEQWVVLTDEGDNTVSFDTPPEDGPSSFVLATAGAHRAFNTFSGSPRVAPALEFHMSKPALVGRYFYTAYGHSQAEAEGASTFALERPVRFWRSSYRIASVGAAENRILALLPEGARVTLDRQVHPGPYRPGPSGYHVLDVGVREGLHDVSSTAPFSILIYGYEMEAYDLSREHAYSYTGPTGFSDVH